MSGRFLQKALANIKGMSHLVVDVSHRLMTACNAQKMAVQRFASNDSNAVIVHRELPLTSVGCSNEG